MNPILYYPTQGTRVYHAYLEQIQLKAPLENGDGCGLADFLLLLGAHLIRIPGRRFAPADHRRSGIAAPYDAKYHSRPTPRIGRGRASGLPNDAARHLRVGYSLCQALPTCTSLRFPVLCAVPRIYYQIRKHVEN